MKNEVIIQHRKSLIKKLCKNTESKETKEKQASYQEI